MEKLRVIIDENAKIKVFMSGKEVVGFRRIRLDWAVGELPVHEIEFISHVGDISEVQ
jgi:hypothetical protein